MVFSFLRFRSIEGEEHCLTCDTIARLNGSHTAIRNFLDHSLPLTTTNCAMEINQPAQFAKSVIRAMALCALVVANMQTNDGGETNTATQPATPFCSWISKLTLLSKSAHDRTALGAPACSTATEFPSTILEVIILYVPTIMTRGSQISTRILNHNRDHTQPQLLGNAR